MDHTIITPKDNNPLLKNDFAFEEERERLHRQMLSSVSHDLKTPLVSIIGALEVLNRTKSKLSEEKQTMLLSVALQEAFRLDSFVTNILDMARLENNAVKAKRENGDVRDLIRHSLTRMNSRLQNSQVIFEPGKSVEVITDTNLFCRAIGLLLDNAVRYGGTPSIIHIHYGTDEHNMAYVTVHDNGEGVPESKMAIIFSKYTRFGKEDQQNAGTGLGLAITRGIMSLLDGNITVANHDEGGAKFTLRIPLQSTN